MLPSLESLSAQETNDAGIPSLYGDIGRFQHEGDMTLPLLKGCLLVLRGPVECRRLEYKLSCHCTVNILNGKWSWKNQNGLERNASGFWCNDTWWCPLGMVLKEAAVYKMVDNFAKNCWIGLKFWHNMGLYKGHLWCEFELPTNHIVGVIVMWVCF